MSIGRQTSAPALFDQETSLVDQLHCKTSSLWLREACAKLPELLSDHANCEKKAAATAINLMFQHSNRPEWCRQFSRLAREELRHFEQVTTVMKQQSIEQKVVQASRYAQGLRSCFHDQDCQGGIEDAVNYLLVCAVIEARSCERFAALITTLDDDLADFYRRLYKSEKRHADIYLDFATELTDLATISQRLGTLLKCDADLISATDDSFGFHSGVPSNS
ncbi:MAG: tRNA-(ms[2]io[6]A)-hydroxylase [Gammaproteobacteria bacterium]|nr:tRNA-(ms[2]io[6]A)-hydroxylase [Gammaproteobacteria bacterium]